ncbi:MAG: hypothetical protein HFK03_02085 [Clostridia bacterium]|jgi:hypothetical protein|nr:hypothetical protein [Clostridia bacterium]
MITIICGDPRVGKTALMTSFAYTHLKGVQAHRDLRECNKLLAPLNAGGFSYTAPSDHLVFADYTVCAGANGSITNYEVDGFYLGLPNATHPTMFLPPASHVYLDEAQKYYDSRKKGLSDFVSRFYELHGHYRLNLTCTVQRPKLIDLNIRELAAQVIYVMNLTHKKISGRIVSSVWSCLVFDDVAAAIAFIEGGKQDMKHGKLTGYAFDGNIFRHYDSYDKRPLFFKDRYTSVFDLRHAVKTGYTLDEIQDFNDQHDYTIPDTYYTINKSR